MEVKLDTNINAVSHRPITKPANPAPPATDSTRFDGAEQLNQSLQTTPESRPDVVARAQQLIGDVTYPPPETIRRLATLLAMHLDKDPN
ncbi:MAG: hypothetical protein U1G07_01380 [Verrucomicrobiota bacterium]